MLAGARSPWLRWTAVLVSSLFGCGARTALEVEADADVELVDECGFVVPPPCEPGAATEEVCNGLDDDCDGGIDEQLPLTRIGGPWIARAEPASTATSPTTRRSSAPTPPSTSRGASASIATRSSPTRFGAG